MQTHRITATVPHDKTLTLDELPFPVGQSVEIIIVPRQEQSPRQNGYPLRGTPVTYDDPTDPVAETDWEAVR